jgi:hypothetical protein
MCSRNGADLLPQVLTHLEGKVDHIYSYDDGSVDNTYNLLKNGTDYVGRDDPRRSECSRGHYRHLLEKVREDFKGEDVWCILTMDDRFFLNKYPHHIVRDAEDGGYDAVEGVQLDFLRHRLDPWTKENDTYPKYHNIREVCRWACVDERCVVAFKLHDGLSYDAAKYPWPQGIQNRQYASKSMGGKLSLEMPYLEHQGRRSPEHFRQSYLTGSRPISKKYKDKWDLSTWDSTVECNKAFFAPYRVVPWINHYTSLPTIVDAQNSEGLKDKIARRYYYWGLEAAQRIAYAGSFSRGDV